MRRKATLIVKPQADLLEQLEVARKVIEGDEGKPTRSEHTLDFSEVRIELQRGKVNENVV